MSSIFERGGAMNRVRTQWRWSMMVVGLLAVLCAAVPRAAAQPANDNFTNASVLIGPLGSVFGTTAGASQEFNEPVHWNFLPRPGASQHSVWYRWIAPSTGFISFDTGGSGYDTVLAAYTGASLPTLIQIAADDDSLNFGSFGLQSLMTFFASAGTEYFIAVDGYDYAEAPGTRTGFYFLNWSGASGTNLLAPTGVQFSSSSFQAYENAGFITVTVVSGGGFTTGGTVDYATSDGTALVDTDYFSSSNTLTFGPGEFFKTFTIPLQDNTLQHSNKTILLTLSNPTGEVLLGSLSNAVATILDDETPLFVSPAGQLNVVTYTNSVFGSGSVGTFFLGQALAAVVTENETFESFLGYVSPINDRSAKGAVVTVTRTAPASGRILVDYYTTNTFTFNTNIFGTNFFFFFTNYLAQPGLDYQPVSGTLVFDDYQMMANIVVPVNNTFTTTTPTNLAPFPRLFDVVLANPRPDPSEDPSVIVPTIGVARGSVEILKINNFPGASIERRTYRADEYNSFSQGATNVVLPANSSFVDIDIILPQGGGGNSAVNIQVNAYGYFLLAGSDYADPFRLDLDNTLFTDGAADIINFPDYAPLTDRPGLGGHVTNVRNPNPVSGTIATIPFPAAGTTRRTVRIVITNDSVVEFNEDIGIFLTLIAGNQITRIGNGFANATILFDDQPAGAADREWNPEGVLYTLPRFNDTPGANNSVSAVVVQPDNKTIIAGDFDSYNSVPRSYLARLRTDGVLDTTFNPGTGADAPITSLALYTTGPNAGRMLIGGVFGSYNGVTRNGLARVNANGSLDTTFAPGNGADNVVRTLALQSDGKVIVAGDFTFFDNLNVNRIMRVNANGTLDLTFNPGVGANNSVWALALDESDPSNRVIYVTGDFTEFNGVTRNRIARLTESGALDLSFEPGLGADGAIYALAVQTNRQVIIGGAFGMYHTSPRSAIARINPDGTLDSDYNVGVGFDDSVYALKLQPDGKVVAGGIFNHYNTTRRLGLARLFIGGSLDTSFMDTAYNQFAGFPRTFSHDSPSFVNSIGLQSDGNLMVGGSFTNMGGNLSVHYNTNTMSTLPAPGGFGFTNFIVTDFFTNYFTSINGRTNKLNSGGHVFAPFTRQDKARHFNVARVIGGYTPGPGNLEYDPDSQPFSANENNGTLTVTLRRVDGRLGTVEAVPYSTNNTAIFPFDYTTAVSTQVWAEWNATVAAVNQGVFSPRSVGFVGPGYFPIPLNDDTLQEGNETFGLRVTNAFGSITLGGEYVPLGAAIGYLDGSTATIADNDFNKGEFNFTLAGYLINENGGSAIINVIRTNGTSGTVDVDYRARNGTATSGLDYTAVSGTLRFFSGQTNASFTVPILNGPEVEFDETVILILTNATAGAKLPGGLPNSTATATLTIVDDDFLAGRLQFSVDNFTNSENDVVAVATVTRTGGNVGVLSVNYQTLVGGTAGLGDYVPTNGTLTWASGDIVPKQILIPLILDGVVEGIESVLLRLSSPSLAGALGARTNATLWITDGDSYGTFSFSQPLYESDENGAAPTITVLRSGGSAGPVSVQYATSPLIATPGVDFQDTSGTLIFQPGEFSKTFQVQVMDNPVPDGDKTIQLALSNPVNASLGLITNAVLQIVDDESINTPAGSLDTTFSALSGANAAVYALVRQLDGRLIMAGDFTQVSSVPRNRIARLKPNGLLDSTFDIGPGANGPIRALALTSEGKLLLGGLFTSINSTNRNGIARLSTDGKVDLSFNPGAGADSPVFALAVQPNDKVLVGGSFNTFNNITRPGLARLNTNGVVDASFVTGAGFNGSVYAIAVQNDGKVLVGGEFVSFNGVARTNFVRLNANGTLDTGFNPGLAINAPVRALLVEPDGRIVIGGSFTNISGLTRRFLARLDQTGVLDPNFLPAPALSGADDAVYAIQQQVDGKLLVAGDFKSFNGVTRRGITRLFDADGATDPTINFGNGANAFVAALVIQPDRRIVLAGGFTEYDDQPRQRICRIYGGSLAGSGSLEFSAPQFVIGEASTNAIITVRRRGGTTGEARAEAFTQGGSAVAGVDYLAVSRTLVFAQGETRQQLNVPIIPNDTLEGDRTVGLQLGSFVNVLPGAQPSATLVIQDDETGIGFSAANYAISENAVSGNATITLVRVGGTNTAASVVFNTVVGGAATAFADYIPTNNVTISFAPGELSKQFHVAVLNDALLEGNESILLALSNPSGTTTLGISNAVLNLIDDDAANGSILFATNNFVVDESAGTVAVTLLRTNGSLGNVQVRLTTSNLTASAFSDYTPVSTVVSFAQGETFKIVPIAIINDLQPENDETFLLTLSQPAGGVLILTPNATVTISDNEIVQTDVAFLTNNFFFDESAGTVNVSVVRPNGRRGFLTVDYAVSSGSALAGVDYFASNGTLTFLDGEDTKTFPVTLVNDTEGEGLETVRLSLSNLQGTNMGTITGPTSTLNIVDDDSTLRFSSATYTVVENVGSAVITVLRVGVTNNPVSVTYATATDGTALGGVDFVAVTGVLNWPAGDATPRTFTVPIIDNNILNAAKTVNLVLRDAVGVAAYVATPSNAVLTITDDETVAPLAGPVDPLFNSNFGAKGSVRAVAFDDLQRLYVGGDFTQFHGLAVNRITRLTANGAVDFSFQVGTGVTGTVHAIAPVANGVVIAGAFTNVNGVARGRVARLLLDGSVDATFAPVLGANNLVRALAALTNGQVIIGGDFTTFAGTSAPRLARLNTNGTVDAAFATGSGPNAPVRSVAVQKNGQVLIAGDFTSYSGFLVSRLARLNTDGSLDTTFNTGLGADGTVHSIAVGPDGKIVIGGEFLTINGSPRDHVARLHADGSVDTGFDIGLGTLAAVRAVAVERDGHVLVVGDFGTFDGNPSSGVARLNPDGSLDAGFNVGSGADAPVHAVSLVTRCVPPPVAVMTFDPLPANFTAYSDYAENCLTLRGLTGGHFHATTNGAGTAAQIFGVDGTPQELSLNGFTFTLQSVAVTNLSGVVTATSSSGGTVQLTNGVTTFGAGFVDVVWVRFDLDVGAAVILDDVTVIPGIDALVPQTFAIGGDFEKFNQVQRGGVVVLASSGLASAQFDPRNIPSRAVYASAIFTNAALPAYTGKLAVGGDFTAIVGVEGVNRLARLNIDGTLDASFNSGLGPNGTVRAVAAQPDGKIVFGGLFTSYDFIARAYLGRANADGTLDNTFNFGAGLDNGVLALALQPDGRIVIGGLFSTVYGVSRNGVARMNTNGTVDVSFTVGAGANGPVRAVALQPDGKVLIGGDFTLYNGTPRARIARLNSNGTLDASFNPGTGADGAVNAIALTSGGQVLLGGTFATVNGTLASRLARLTSAGAVDGTFTPGAGADDYVSSIAVQTDGRMVVGGNFTTFNGQVRQRLVRLNADGTLDPTINFGAGANDFISTITLQNYDGKIVVGGGFTEFDGLTRVGIARIMVGTNSGAGTFRFSAPVFSVNERGSNAVLTVVRSGGTTGAASVNYQTVNGTALAPADYVATSGTLNFANAESVKQILIPVNDNTVASVDRLFIVSLSGATGGATIGAPSNAVVIILENESAFNFGSANFQVSENAVVARITVTRTGGLLDAATVDFATDTNGTATAGLDFIPRAGTLTFLPGVRARTFDVTVLDDTINEFNETVPLRLTLPVGASLGLSNATLTIVENDFGAGVISFRSAAYSGSEEAGGIVVELIRTNGYSGGVTVGYQTLAGSATPNVDFVATNGIVTFLDGQTNAFIFIYPIDDVLTEGNETVPVQLFSPSGTATLGLANATVTIVDNDSPGQFVFSTTAYTVSELGGTATITVLRTNGNLGAVSVTVETSGGNATPSLDYQTVLMVLNFASGQSVRTFTISILDDALAEGTETVGLLLSNPTGGTTVGTPGAAVLSIVDNEASVGLASAAFTVPEGATNFPVTLVRLGDTNVGFTVTLNTTDGSATSGADYIGSTTTVTFAPGQTNRVVAVPILPDALAEGDETINLTLSSPSAGVALGPIITGVLTILDDDTGFNFSSATYATNESVVDLVITVRRVGSVAGVAAVDFLTTDGTATAGLDYLTATGRLAFAAGQTSGLFNVRIQDDVLVENNETVLLALANPSAGTFLGGQATAILSILDNDTTVGLSPTTYVVNEKVTNAVITLVRNGAAGQAVSVGFRTQNSSATAGVDYSFTTQTVAWAAGDLAPKTVLVPVFDDAVAEGTETVTLILSGAVNATIDPLAASGVLSIIDDAGSIAFAAASSSAVEGAGDAVIHLLRTGGSSGIVSVQWNATGGSATAGADYFSTFGTVVFASNELVKPILFPMVDDATVEGIETVVLTLSNPTGGARVGSPASAVLSILDNDSGLIVAAGAALVGESILPTNNIIDPNETVTVLLGLRNSGTVNAANVTAGLVYANGISNSAPQTQSYGLLTAGGSSVSRPFTFTALGTNGTRITATLLVTNNGVFLGPVAFDFVLGSQSVAFANGGFITIPAFGQATPYPAPITVSGVSGPITKITVSLNNIHHTQPSQMDILLVGPNGTAVMLMSDAGTNIVMNGVNLTFDDTAAAVPQFSAITSGTYRCTNYPPVADSFNPPYAVGTGFWTNTPALSAFNGSDANGVWSLYVVDDSVGDNGDIAGGWSLNISTANIVASGADLAVLVSDSPDPVLTNGTLTYTIGVTNFGPATATSVVLTNVLPASTIANAPNVSGPGTYTLNGNVLRGSLGSLAPGAGVVVTITVIAPSVTGQLTFDTTVTSTTADPNALNNFASIKTTVSDSVPVPLLFVARKNSQVVLSWQGSAPNVVLEASALLGVSWTNAAVTPVVSNGVSTVTLPMDSGGKFYRLKRTP